jgi:uncharacterized protein
MKFIRAKLAINYLYFTLTIIFVSLLSLSHILSIQHVSTYLKIILSIYAIMQAFLEVSIFILVGFAFKHLSKIFYRIYIGFLFLFLIVQYADFTILRLMDMTIITTFKIFFASGIDHFLSAIKALNLNLSMGLIILSVILTVPLIGIFFYLKTHKITLKKPLALSAMQVGITCIYIVLALFIFEIIAMPHLSKELHAKCEKILPLKSTFLSPICSEITLDNQIITPKEDYKKINYKLIKKPNIYLFIIETLRKDIITNDIAPNLFNLKAKSVKLQNTYANANASQYSWFSILNAKYPFHFKKMSEKQYFGAIPLKILKDLGYKIHVHSSADLKYFNMDEKLFGKNTYLVDKFHDYTKNNNNPAYRDLEAMKSLMVDMKKNNDATCFIIFLDSTHSEYSWTDEFPYKFKPISKEIDYLTISHTRKGLNKLINRYKNSVNFIDYLFTDFLKNVNEENSLIIITGDHGEEFFEDGALFHGTHLNYYQTAVPLLYKVNTNKKLKTNLSSHIDIFPTIFDCLIGENTLDSYFDGKSIFSDMHLPYTIIIQQNGGENPIEFALTGLNNKMILRFKNPNDIYKSKDLEIIALKPTNDNEKSKIQIKKKTYDEFNTILKKIIR